MSVAAASVDEDSDAEAWAEYEALPVDPPPARTFNHGGPGVCLMCYPNGITRDVRKPVQAIEQGELQL